MPVFPAVLERPPCLRLVSAAEPANQRARFVGDDWGPSHPEAAKFERAAREAGAHFAGDLPDEVFGILRK